MLHEQFRPIHIRNSFGVYYTRRELVLLNNREYLNCFRIRTALYQQLKTPGLPNEKEITAEFDRVVEVMCEMERNVGLKYDNVERMDLLMNGAEIIEAERRNKGFSPS